MRMININKKNSINIASDVLKRHGILIFPTDTVYGIGCLLDDVAIRRLYKIKNRPLNQPTAILLTKKIIPKMRSSANKGLNIPENIEREFKRGKITLLILTNWIKIKLPAILTKDNKIGVRLPKYQWLEKLIDMVGPIVTSSANKKGEPAPSRIAEIDQDIIEKADLTIKTDEKLSGNPSRVYDLETKEYYR